MGATCAPISVASMAASDASRILRLEATPQLLLGSSVKLGGSRVKLHAAVAPGSEEVVSRCPAAIGLAPVKAVEAVPQDASCI